MKEAMFYEQQQAGRMRCRPAAALLIERYGFTIRTNHIRNGTCPDCGTAIVGIGM